MSRFNESVEHFAVQDPVERLRRLDKRLRLAPRCPVTRFLAGCVAFDRGRPATAVEHLMIAHHAEPQLESASLLVFTGLAAAERRGEPLLRVLLDTWEEFRRPRFDRLPRERRLLRAWSDSNDRPAGASSLARRLARLPIPCLRSQIASAIASPAVEPYGLLLPSA